MAASQPAASQPITASAQPLTAAPSPAPTAVTTSAMPEMAAAPSSQPQYFNSSSSNMIPVVDKPLDINKVPDSPAEQFNPFASANNANAAPKPSKKSSGSAINLILGLLTILFVVTAGIFFYLWQQALNSKTILPSQPSQPGQVTETPTPASRRLSCRGNSEITEEDAATGITSNVSIYEVNYPDENPTEIRVTSTAEYNSPEAAAAVYAETANETFAYLSGIFAAIGIDVSTDDFTLDGNTVSATFVIPAAKLTDPEATVLSRQMLATMVGFPSEMSEDGATLTVKTDIDSVRAAYEEAALVCTVSE